MVRHFPSFWWAAAVALCLLAMIAGCGDKKTDSPATDMSRVPPEGEAHDMDDGGSHEGHNHGDEGEESDSGEKPSLDTLKDAMSEASVDEQLQTLETLTDFLMTGEEQLSQDAAEILYSVASGDGDDIVRAEAVRSLGLRAKVFEDAIIGFVDDTSETVREAAITALAACGEGTKGEAKLFELAKSDSIATKELAERALSAMREGAAEDPLALSIAQLGNPEGDQGAQAAIKVKLAGAKALPALKKVIENTTSARQRHAATMCVALICAGSNPRQQEFASTVRSTYKDDTVAPPSNLEGLGILARALDSADPMTREIAAQGLGYLGDERAAKHLAKALKDKDFHVRRRAASALITTPADSVQKVLSEAAIGDDDEMVRRFAVEALGWIGGSAVVPALVKAAKDPSPEVRRYTAVQLGKHKSPETLDALTVIYEDARKRELAAPGVRAAGLEQDVRWAAVQAVAELRDKNASDLLVRALNDPVPQVANAAEAGLQKIGVAKVRLPGFEEKTE